MKKERYFTIPEYPWLAVTFHKEKPEMGLMQQRFKSPGKAEAFATEWRKEGFCVALYRLRKLHEPVGKPFMQRNTKPPEKIKLKIKLRKST